MTDEPPRPSIVEWFDQRFRAPVTLFILGLCVAWFIKAESLGSTLKATHLVTVGALQRDLIWAGEGWRLVTAMFLHIGWLHLVWNVWFMFSLCSLVERVAGWWGFLVLYLGSGIGASAVSVLGHDKVSAGASGAAFGMIGVIQVLRYRAAGSAQRYWTDPVTRSTMIQIALWVVIGMTVLPMDNFAHLGGLAFGILLSLPFILVGPRRRIAAFVAVFLLVGTVVASLQRWPYQSSRVGEILQRLREKPEGTTLPDAPP